MKTILRHIAVGFLVLNILVVSVGLTVYQSSCESGCDTHVSLSEYKDECCENEKPQPKEAIKETYSCCVASSESCGTESKQKSGNDIEEECCDFSIFSFCLEIKKPIDEEQLASQQTIDLPEFWVIDPVIRAIAQPHFNTYHPPPPDAGTDLLNRIQVYLL